MVAVTIKHSARIFELNVDTSTNATSLRQEVSGVTGVPNERLKIMLRGKLIKDSSDLSLKAGDIITALGSSDVLPSPPVQATETPVFDSMADDQRHHPGLLNLGQTCYLNSDLQVLNTVQPLWNRLSGIHSTAASPSDKLVRSLAQLLATMRSQQAPVIPVGFLNSLRDSAPQFRERDTGGGFAQQDADEALGVILNAINSSRIGEERSVAQELFGIQLSTTSQCLEAPEEPATATTEYMFKLACNITITTNHLMAGINNFLEQEIEKTSPSLGRLARYSSKSRVMRAPPFLLVHLGRFYWRRDIQKKAKIMRKVEFPMSLDIRSIMSGDGEPTGGNSAGSQVTGMYSLQALVTHKGASADTGHYIAWTRDSAALGEPRWLKYDDDKVSSVTTTHVLGLSGGGQDSSAYILLYGPPLDH